MRVGKRLQLREVMSILPLEFFLFFFNVSRKYIKGIRHLVLTKCLDLEFHLSIRAHAY